MLYKGTEPISQVLEFTKLKHKQINPSCCDLSLGFMCVPVTTWKFPLLRSLPPATEFISPGPGPPEPWFDSPDAGRLTQIKTPSIPGLPLHMWWNLPQGTWGIEHLLGSFFLKQPVNTSLYSDLLVSPHRPQFLFLMLIQGKTHPPMPDSGLSPM